LRASVSDIAMSSTSRRTSCQSPSVPRSRCSVATWRRRSALTVRSVVRDAAGPLRLGLEAGDVVQTAPLGGRERLLALLRGRGERLLALPGGRGQRLPAALLGLGDGLPRALLGGGDALVALAPRGGGGLARGLLGGLDVARPRPALGGDELLALAGGRGDRRLGGPALVRALGLPAPGGLLALGPQPLLGRGALLVARPGGPGRARALGPPLGEQGEDPAGQGQRQRGQRRPPLAGDRVLAERVDEQDDPEHERGGEQQTGQREQALAHLRHLPPARPPLSWPA
jgi:hypothetical protein